MRHQLLCALFLFIGHWNFASTWVGGGGDTLWNNSANWNTGSVPGNMDDVTIPAGFTVTLDNPGADIKSLIIEMGATLNMLGGTFIFSDFVTVDGTLNFNRPITGGGTLTNNGIINLSNTNGTLSSNIGGPTTLINDGDIFLNDIGDLVLESGCVLTNLAGGEIFLNSNSTGITRSGAIPHVLNNSGKIVSSPPMGTDQNTINVQLINNGGTVEVTNGMLFLDSDSLGSEHNGGVYNTMAGTTLSFNDTTLFSGTLTGTNDGTINLKDTMNVPVGVIINIGGAGIINFDPTITGGGTVTNTTTLNIGALPLVINDNSTLLNQSVIEFDAAGDILISSGSTLNNDVGGTIDFKGDTGNIQSGAGGAQPHAFLNSGMIKTSFTGNGSDTAQISVDMIHTGIIEVSNGTIFLFDNDIQLNGGTYNIGMDGILDLDNIVTAAGSFNGTISGNGIFKWNGKINVPVAASFDFGGTGIIDWFNGSLDGGGTLTNNNTLLIGNGVNGFIFGGSTLVNNGIINFLSNDDLLIETGGTLNNTMFGDINFLGDGAQVGVNGVAPRLFINDGDIVVNLPNADDDVTILCEFNNSANIEVQRGVFNLNNATKDAQNLVGGVYNVFADGAFDWDGNVTLLGTLTGNLQGPITWRSSVWVNAPNTATFFFSGIETILWNTGSLNGGGTLINSDTINITATGTLFINDGTNFRNEGNFNFTTFGDLQLASNGVFDNLVNGTIELQIPAANISTSGAAPHALNNLGTIIFDTGGVNSVAINTNNTGTIDIRSGELDFNNTFILTNDTSGIIKGNGILDIPSPSNFINNGTVAPGNSPGTLTVLGDYSSTSTAVLEIEIDGPMQGSEFDFVPITGDDVVFDGQVDVIMGYNASVNDEFIIATTSGSIMTCDIAPTATANFNGNTYNFDVICRNGDELVLTVVEVLSVDDVSFNERHLRLVPNPANDLVILINESQLSIESVFIYDVSGRLIFQDINGFNSEERQINIQNFTEGLYLVKVNSSRGSATKRLLVKR